MTTYTDRTAARTEIETILESQEGGLSAYDVDAIAEQAIITSESSTPVSPRYEISDSFWDIVWDNLK